MEKLKAPKLICGKCGAFGMHLDLAGHRHRGMHNGVPCGGTWESTVASKLVPCTNCGATGRGEAGRCTICEGHGWLRDSGVPT